MKRRVNTAAFCVSLVAIVVGSLTLWCGPHWAWGVPTLLGGLVLEGICMALVPHTRNNNGGDKH